MCCGWSPFYAEDTQEMYDNICFGKIRFPKGVIKEEGKLFVKGVCGAILFSGNPHFLLFYLHFYVSHGADIALRFFARI
jgi:hypothetical protein